MIEQAERTSVWEYVNPVAITKFAYTSPLGSFLYGPYRALAQGRGLMLPGLAPGLGSAVKFAEVPQIFGSVIKGEGAMVARIGSFAKKAGRALAFGVEGGGVAHGAEGLEAVALARRGLIGWRAQRVASAGRMTGLAKVEALANAFQKSRPAATVMARSGLIMAGRVINPIMNAILIAQTAAFVGETVFKGIRATSEAINRAAEKVYNLDLGGELSRGYLSAGAATERQRALQAIQSSHLAGRRFLGSEADMVHNTYG